jgi:CRP/FNR family transcriptional regulator, anaerobic regulatory protein
MLASGGRRATRHTQDVFRSLAKSEASLIEALTLRSANVPANRVLFDAGEIGTNLHCIVRGWAYRYRTDGNGSRQILDFLLPGEVIGLPAALLGMAEHSVRSLTALRVNSLDVRLVGEAFQNEPALALRLARYVAAAAERVDELLTVIGCRDAIGRLAFLMMSLHRRLAHHGRVDPLDTPFPLRRQHLADALGLTGAHVNRTLNRLRQDGIATIENDRLAIHDLPRLAAIAGVTPD